MHWSKRVRDGHKVGNGRLNVKADGLKLYQKYAGTIVTDPRESVKLGKAMGPLAAATTQQRKQRE